jgi:5-formyltetrahydrofolate cyclo-ligase
MAACNQDTTVLRKQIRQQRRQLDSTTQRQNSLALCDRIIHNRDYKTCKTLAVYLANDGEIDPSPIIEHAWRTNKRVYLPVLAPLKNSLYFAPYTPDSQLVPNRFNIPEPVGDKSKWKLARQLGLILVPLVAFDAQANRIGMGGGFYDRTLAYRRHRQYWRKPVLIGLAHELQKVEAIKQQAWDIPVNAILTESQSYIPSSFS